MHPRALTLVLTVAAALLAPFSAVPAVAQEAEEFHSDNMSHVANLAYEIAHPERRAESTHIPFGTDIEFASLLTSRPPASLERVAGVHRIATAAALSAATFDRADTVLVATSLDYADALAGSPLAVAEGAPLLLSVPWRLSPEVAAEIDRLGAEKAVLLGGTAALGEQVETGLQDAGVETRRVGGANRFATAALIMDELPDSGEVLVAEGVHADPGRGWPDALSAAGLASARGLPILLVTANELPSETAEALSEHTDVTIVGGRVAVSDAVALAIDERAGDVGRISGAHRYETSRRVADEAVRRGADPANTWIATGRSFPDGLVAGAATGAVNGVLLLVDGADIGNSPNTEAFVRGNADRIDTLLIAGGSRAVGAAVETRLRAALGTEPRTSTREYAIAGSYYNGMQIIDITHPQTPKIAAVWDCGTLQGDIQVFSQGDRTYATFTSEDTSNLIVESRCVQDNVEMGNITFEDLNGDGEITTYAEKVPGYGTYVADITDPLNPTTAGFIPVPEGSHNGTVHPSGDYFYNSNSRLIIDSELSPGVEVYDISDLANRQPERLVRMPLPTQLAGLGTDSHDITFNAAGTRAYSAALSQTVIIDTEDPANPEVISNFVDPAINVEHQADPITVTTSDGTVRELLIVEDELAGAAGNASCPGGGVHIYDITGENEEDPQSHKVGMFFIPEFRPAGSGSGQGESVTCTAHVFRLYPEQGIMTIAWYNAGVWVVDISRLADEAMNPSSQPMDAVGFFYFSNSDTWSFKTNKFEDDGSFFGYGNDIARGFDVFRFDATIGG